jgi:hypothetical protein
VSSDCHLRVPTFTDLPRRRRRGILSASHCLGGNDPTRIARVWRTAPYEDEILFMSLGGVLSELHAYPEALRYLETASAINPLNEDVARNLKIARTNAGQD